VTGLLIPTIVDGIRTHKDGSVAITLITQELSAGKAADLFGLRNKLCAAYLSPKESIQQSERDQVDKIDVELTGKTPSQRVRNTLFILWQQDNEGHSVFDTFYKTKIELYIDHLKSKIA
jgi:hypothetical protein